MRKEFTVQSGMFIVGEEPRWQSKKILTVYPNAKQSFVCPSNFKSKDDSSRRTISFFKGGGAFILKELI